ncbi:flagellar biosynthetic protein FliR [Marinobacterium jannaschii]|uniref:flagellar biosynthetic protein FliR n=1 Tax=Marinobacterium jannaschii TaxID=64970 RepID=UPI000481FB6B|nr:flagellar biosynthetic protein FliR [Marinobacterium jannaschii]
MFELSFLQIESMVATFLLPLFRVASFLMVIPIIGSQLLPVNIRLGLAIVLTILLLPGLPEIPSFNALAVETWIVVAQQILIGIVMGFMVQVLFQVVVLGGQMIAQQMGLGFASMTDPANGISVVMLGQFYLTLVMVLFITMNGHLVMIDILARSFHLIPIGSGGLPDASLWKIVRSGTWLFSAALLMALPAVTSLLVVNFAFGIMTRAAPQLNIFAIGFPFTMLMGMLIVWANLGGFLGQYRRLSEFMLNYITSLLM